MRKVRQSCCVANTRVYCTVSLTTTAMTAFRADECFDCGNDFGKSLLHSTSTTLSSDWQSRSHQGTVVINSTMFRANASRAHLDLRAKCSARLGDIRGTRNRNRPHSCPRRAHSSRPHPAVPNRLAPDIPALESRRFEAFHAHALPNWSAVRRS